METTNAVLLPLLAQDDGMAAGILGGGMLLFWLAVVVVVIIGMWKVFEKAGVPGWQAIIPILNLWRLAEIGGKEGWFGLLVYVPCVGIVFAFIVCIAVAKKFGKDALFGVGLALLGFIFFPILGFGSATYDKARPA